MEMWKTYESIILPLLVIAILTSLIIIVICIKKNPFKYPYKSIYIDISGRRSPRVEDLIDEYLIDFGLDDIIIYNDEIKQWKCRCKQRINKSPIRKIRYKQYLECIDDEGAIVFKFTRTQTRYEQRNYVRHSYKVDTVVDRFYTNIKYLKGRYNSLEEIDFECTLSQYHAKNQRKLMTPRLRSEIAERDNYTCQICGKYMPDGVGLHIDHIIPIAKGGKSVPSNLQVLCSKCNGRKSSK